MKLFVGSSAQDNVGIGNLHIGHRVEKTEGGYRMKIDPFEWLEIYDFMVLENGGLRSPETTDISETTED